MNITQISFGVGLMVGYGIYFALDVIVMSVKDYKENKFLMKMEDKDLCEYYRLKKLKKELV